MPHFHPHSRGSNTLIQHVKTGDKKKNRGGRPLLSFAELSARKATRAAKRRWKDPEDEEEHFQQGKKRRKRTTSLLEQLPVELIEKIFLYALETNLCRASPYLAAAVSSERIYRTLIRLAFWDDDASCSYGPVRNAEARKWLAKTFQPADYYRMRLDTADRTRLQATILRCKWCTKARIQAQLPTLMQMAIQRYWFGAGINFTDPAEQTSLNDFLHRKEDSKVFQGVSPDGNTYYMSVIPLVSVSINCAEENVRQVHRVLSLRVIPDHLLRGSSSSSGGGGAKGRREGFSDENIELLEIFRHAYGFDGNGKDVQFSRDALQKGILTALRTQNARALTTLLKIDEFFFRRRLETSSAPPSSLISSQNEEYHHYSIPAEYFVRAVNLLPTSPNSVNFFKLLLRCNAESVPPDSPEVTQWAMDLSEGYEGEENVVFGRWLLDFMVELPRHIDVARRRPREEALFYYGAVNMQSRVGRRFIEEVCAGDPDGWQRTWMQTMSFDVSKTWLLNASDT